MPNSANWRNIVSICAAEGFPDANEVYEKCMLMFNKYRYIKWHKQQSPPKKKSRKEIEKERRELRRRFLDLFWKPLKENEKEMEELVEDAMNTSWFDELLTFAIGIISFFDKGKTYKKILEVCYLNADEKDTQLDRQLACGLGRTSFNDKHKEAVTLIGIEAWMHAKNMEYEEMAKDIVEKHEIYPDNIKEIRDSREYFLHYFEPRKHRGKKK